MEGYISINIEITTIMTIYHHFLPTTRCLPTSHPHQTHSYYAKSFASRKVWWYIIHQHPYWDLFDLDPSNSIFTNGSDKTLPVWISHNCKATILLPTMDQPKHGSLFQTKDKWFFKSGKGTSVKIIELIDFHSVARDMIKDFVLFQGHKRYPPSPVYHPT